MCSLHISSDFIAHRKNIDFSTKIGFSTTTTQEELMGESIHAFKSTLFEGVQEMIQL